MFKRNDKVYSLLSGEGTVSGIGIGDTPVEVRFSNGWFDVFTSEGFRYSKGRTQLLYHGKPEIIAPPEPQRFPDVALDQPVLVSRRLQDRWIRCYFRGWSEDGMLCWGYGKTSWTAHGKDPFDTPWKYWTLDLSRENEC